MYSVATARILFNVALGAVFVPFVGPVAPLVFGVLYLARPEPELRRWGRRLLALAIFDALLFSLLFVSMGREVLEGREPGPMAPTTSRRVIGVGFEAPRDLHVREVLPDSPAEKAGLEPGDLITQVNGHTVSTRSQLQREIEASPTVEITFERNQQQHRTTLQPVEAKSLLSSRGKLFTPAPGETCGPFEHGMRFPWALLAAAVVVTVLHVLGRRRGMDATLVWAGALLLAVAVVTEAGTLGVCALAGGPSPGVMLAGIGIQTVTLLLGGWILYRRARPELRVADEVPSRRGPVAVALGVWYLVTGGFRVGGFLLALSVLLGANPYQVAEAPLQSLAVSGLGPLGVLLFVVPVVFLAPLSEELLFRGIVLPWLSRWMPVWAAIGTSAAIFGALHFQYGLFLGVIVFYGVVLGWARVTGRSLRAPILLHMLINGMATVVLLSQ